MQAQEIHNKVVGLITPYAKNADAVGKINEETKILEDLGVNSARLVDIILAFEDEFNIEVDDEAADEIWTVGDAVNLVKDKIQ